MKRTRRRLLPIVAALGLAAPAQAAPALWEVRDADSAIWLFGSFHVLPDGANWRTELFNSIVAEADQVVFEADLRPVAAAQIGAEAFVRGVYADGTYLTDVIDDALEAELRAKIADIDLPMGAILGMRPWMATNTIAVQALTVHGFRAEGVEVVMQPGLSDDRIAFLETGQEQLDILAGASEDEQVAMLRSTLQEFDTMPKAMSKMVKHWLNGTPEQLTELFLSEMGGFEETIMERVIYARNRNWIAPLTEMLDGNRQNLVIVGAGHMVGEGSVIDLLERAGYSVNRIQ